MQKINGKKMRKIILYLQLSLDGVVSDPDKWATISDEIIASSLEAYKSLDTILVGSNGYASLAEYWQQAEHTSESEIERRFAKEINNIKKYVISRSNVDLVWKNSEQLFINDEASLVSEINKLRQTEGKNISVESGLKTWQLFLKNDLFDELALFFHPVIAGHGDKLFTDLNKTNLELINTKKHENGVISLHYKKA
ncbi:dihydrofolate reductase family protein [Spirosoma sp. KNUC1025]|uniref:dihydrofolate reductase family protein n=1 Tax=Spirosoma sp. KNUC1025 TaxID=2894082 RepID=UPI00386C83D2|nr:dihydrofolate reductase family protein [Spirosoma sp. KNUC1025]